MKQQSTFHLSDIRGATHIAADVLDAVTQSVDARAHDLLVRMPGGAKATAIALQPARAATWILRRVGSVLPDRSRKEASGPRRETLLAILNGLIGDYLAAAGNPLAIPMRFRRRGRAIELSREGLAAAFPRAGSRLLIMVHGLCCSDRQWRRKGHDHGMRLARELGYIPLYLHYNTGVHISVNGRELAAQLQQLVSNWPVEVEEIAILAHSMGGLVARSALHHGAQDGSEWTRVARHVVFLGTPHHGAPLERAGNWIGESCGKSVLTAPLAKLGRIRSAGITDLRYGNLIDADWHGRCRFSEANDNRRHVALPRGVKCYAIAGSTGRRRGDMRERLFGDGLIPLDTALGHHAERRRTLKFRPSHQYIAHGIHHLDLLSHPQVYDKIRDWLGDGS